MNEKLFDFIGACPTPYNAVEYISKRLKELGYVYLSEHEPFCIVPGGKYFTSRADSSIIAFRIPKESFTSFIITASHSDSPTLKIKENGEISLTPYKKLSVEKYGGMIYSSWMDRPLSVAGRVVYNDGTAIRQKAVDLISPAVIIPNVAIHMKKNINDTPAYNPAVDMLPIYYDKKDGTLLSKIADSIGISEEDIISHDLYLYNTDKGKEYGGMISAPRLDDLECAFASFTAFLSSEDASSTAAPVFALFNNEEVGSRTIGGADSTFLSDTLKRISNKLPISEEDMSDSDERYTRRLAMSFMASCDNAHALHPNHPELSDSQNAPAINGGIVIKHNANTNYATDGISAAIFKTVCNMAGCKTQTFTNRADMPGGSTLGNISGTHVSINTVDIGLAQLAMHSAYETAGADDTKALTDALDMLYRCHIIKNSDSSYIIEKDA